MGRVRGCGVSRCTIRKALDRLQPLMHNVATGGGTWIPPKVTEIQVEQRYGVPIKHGAPRLWEHALEMVRQHFALRTHS